MEKWGQAMDSTNNINRFLCDLFPDAMDFDGEFSSLKQLKVDRMSVFIKANRLEIYTTSLDIVSIALIMKAEDCLKQKLGAPNLTIRVKCGKNYSIEEYLSSMWSELIQMLTSKVALCRGILPGSKYEISGNKIIISLLTAGADILRAQNCHSMLEQHIKDAICHYV